MLFLKRPNLYFKNLRQYKEKLLEVNIYNFLYIFLFVPSIETHDNVSGVLEAWRGTCENVSVDCGAFEGTEKTNKSHLQE